MKDLIITVASNTVDKALYFDYLHNWLQGEVDRHRNGLDYDPFEDETVCVDDDYTEGLNDIAYRFGESLC